MIVIRKLAALDIAFLGPVLIITEFLVGVIGPLLLGGWIALRGHSWSQYLTAFYFVALGVNYVPLLVYALLIRNKETARGELVEELSEDQRIVMRRYRRGSLLLLIPFVVPVLAFAQRDRRQTLGVD